MRTRWILTAVFLLAGCHHGSGAGSSSGAGSTPTSANATGNWHGAVTIKGTPTLMVFALIQSSTSVAGLDIVTGVWSLPRQSGTLAGTVSPTTLTFNLSEYPTPTCSGSFSGTASVFVSSMTLTYSGSESGTCGGLPGGVFSGITGTFFNSYL